MTALRAEGRRALVCYVTAGHPDPASSVALLRGIESAGADVIELGIPFSDPMADGPIIQASSQRALDHGMTLARTLDLIRKYETTEEDAQKHWEDIKEDRVLIVVTPERFQWRYDD